MTRGAQGWPRGTWVPLVCSQSSLPHSLQPFPICAAELDSCTVAVTEERMLWVLSVHTYIAFLLRGLELLESTARICNVFHNGAYQLISKY